MIPDIATKAHRVMAALKGSLQDDWADVYHDTETYKTLTKEQKEECLTEMIRMENQSVKLG